DDLNRGNVKVLRRLWRCTPYGATVTLRGDEGRPPPGCGLPRLCPWCHARKVARLHHCLANGPLKDPGVSHLFFGKAVPFPEPFGGVDGSYEYADWNAYSHGGRVRGHWGRYYGLGRERADRTRRALAACLVAQAQELGLRDGLW